MDKVACASTHSYMWIGEISGYSLHDRVSARCSSSEVVNEIIKFINYALLNHKGSKL